MAELIATAGQTAFVTGAAGGLGRALVQRFKAEGVNVVATDFSAEGLSDLSQDWEQWQGTAQLMTAQADITDPAAVEKIVAAGVAEFGTIQIAVNSAGIGGLSAPIWEIPVDYWQKIYDVHVNGTFYVLRSVLPVMKDAGYGRVVNVSSSAGKQGSPNSAAYSSAKAAVLGMTKSVGKELATSGVLVNAITPGVIETPLNQQASPEYLERMLSRIPMQRAAKPEEIVEMIWFLSTPKTSFSTGAVFDLSGGTCSY